MPPPALALDQVCEAAGAATAMAPTAAIERRILFMTHTPQGRPASPGRTIGPQRVLQFCGRAMLWRHGRREEGESDARNGLTGGRGDAACRLRDQRERTDARGRRPIRRLRPRPIRRATPGPAPASSDGDSIPAAFHGVYDASLEACARPSDLRLTVSAARASLPREHRHRPLGRLRRRPARSRSRPIIEGEGERWRNLRILSLCDDGARLTIKGDGDSLDRIRCPRESSLSRGADPVPPRRASSARDLRAAGHAASRAAAGGHLAPLHAGAARSRRLPAVKRLGRLDYLGGWALTSNDARLGGISALHVEGARRWR